MEEVGLELFALAVAASIFVDRSRRLPRRPRLILGVALPLLALAAMFADPRLPIGRTGAAILFWASALIFAAALVVAFRDFLALARASARE